MSRRHIDTRPKPTDGREKPASAKVRDSAAQCDNSSEAKRRLQRPLAEYFAILREWSLNGRSDIGLAPDSTQQP